PDITASNVDFPAPDGPTTAHHSPGRIRTSTSRSTGRVVPGQPTRGAVTASVLLCTAARSSTGTAVAGPGVVSTAPRRARAARNGSQCCATGGSSANVSTSAGGSSATTGAKAGANSPAATARAASQVLTTAATPIASVTNAVAAPEP